MKKLNKLEELAKNAKHPGKKAKENVDNWLDDNVNQPLAKRGFGALGAGISTAGSLMGDMLIPESDAEAAAAGVPGTGLLSKLGKALKGGKKTSKLSKLVDDTAEKFEPDQTLSKFKQLEQPTAPAKTDLIGDLNPVKKRKDIRGEKKAIKDSKTREAHGNLKEKKIEEEWERKARLGENPSSPVLDYSKMK